MMPARMEVKINRNSKKNIIVAYGKKVSSALLVCTQMWSLVVQLQVFFSYTTWWVRA